MTRARTLLVAFVVLTAACGGSKTSTQPSTNPNTIVFTAQLLPGNERPTPVTAPNVDATGSGNVTVTANVTRDSSNNISTANLTFQVNLSGFPANTTLTGAHIHVGDANTAGGIVINTSLTSGEIVLGNGTGGFTKIVNGADVATVQAMINNPAGYYFNVHTTVNGGGAARGQLVKQ
jgi:CHRD domain-containing protein